MPRVLIVCDGDGDPVVAVSSSFTDSPQYAEALAIMRSRGDKSFRVVFTPQSQIDRFALPGEDC